MGPSQGHKPFISESFEPNLPSNALISGSPSREKLATVTKAPVHFAIFRDNAKKFDDTLAGLWHAVTPGNSTGTRACCGV